MHELLEPPKDQNQVRVITIVGASNRIKLGKQRERKSRSYRPRKGCSALIGVLAVG